MQDNSDVVIDPVCGMSVPADQLSLEYKQMHFAFCCEQCRERFLANPGLYVGKPGMMSMKQMGHEVIKCRHLKLAQTLPPGKDAELKSALYAMMGIKGVTYESENWKISYDLLQVTTEQIERTMLEFGGRLGGNWAEKLHRAFVHYVEETELLNLEDPGGAHSHHH